MLGWILFLLILVGSFISGLKNPSSTQDSRQADESNVEPIYDDGEIVAWYEE